MNTRLQNQVAWISGAASGMGQGIARLFAREGAAVALVDVQVAKGQAIAEQIRAEGGRAIFIECDVRLEAAVRSSIEQTVREFGKLHTIVNCAGIVQVKLLHELDVADWNRLMDINVKSIFLSIKHGIAHLKKNPRSYVVNIGSIGSFISQSSTPAYIASKGAVLMLSKSIALDYAADGVRCNCVCPGITDTPMLREHLNATADPEATLRNRLRRVPMGVSLTPYDIAKAVLYFSCEDSAGVTGTSLVIDGGYLAAAEWEHPGKTRFMLRYETGQQFLSIRNRKVHLNSPMQPLSLLSRREFARQTVSALGLAVMGLDMNSLAQTQTRHRFLCCDYQGNKVAIIAADGSIEWEFATQTPQDCWLLPNGNVLFCYSKGAKEVSRDKQVVWEYKAPEKAQCHSCQPLPDGRVLVAECGMSRLIEAGRDGQVAKEIKVASQAKNMGHQFRGTRKTADGHYWVCLMDEKKIVELSPAGALLREIPVDGFPHAAIKLPDGHLLVTLGTAGKVIELDADLKIVWQLGENEVPGNPLRLPAGCQRLANGNTIVCNYLPGQFMGKQPQAFEVTRDKRVVWEFTDHARFKTVNQIYLLDTPSDGKKAEVLR